MLEAATADPLVELVPLGGSLVSVSELQNGGLSSRTTTNLQSDRQRSAVKPQGTEIVGNPSMLIGRVLCSIRSSRARATRIAELGKRERRHWRCGRDQEIHVVEEARNGVAT